MHKLGFILGFTLGTCVLVAACSSSSVKEGEEPSGGAGGSAGKTNGGTGATNPGSCTQHPDCKSFGDCQTLEDLRATECGNEDYTMEVTVCGGTYVEFSGAATASTWLFDANGQPIGGFYEDESSCSEWGTTCAPAGPTKPLCSDECTTLDSCEAWASRSFGSCPASLDALSDCHLGIGLERQASGCGGIIISTTDETPNAMWTFDAAGQLVAAAGADDLDCWQWGTPCDKPRLGKSELLCVGAGEGGMGGQGGAGAGGAGGAAGAGGSG
ncbi:MAG TPA: hypothetical protein VHP33_16865 [Polyangiaceae bacterium]|nr:hypothetical protein [Polyangiaceae bacterium]